MTKKIISLLLICLFFLLFSCGLEVYYLLEPPTDSSNISNPDNPSDQVFSFTTADIKNTNPSIVGNVKYLGTQVYYKIYSSKNRMQSQQTSINNSNSEYTESGINKLESYGFKKLASSNYSDPLIPKSSSGKNQRVEIRLFDNYPYKATVSIDQTNMGIPLRYDGSTFSITPGSEIQGEDVDSTSSGNSNDEMSYYVLLYAVSVGSVNLSQRIRSSLCPLGYIKL